MTATPTLEPSPLADGGELRLDEARAALASALSPLAMDAQTLPLLEALGRVLATAVVSPIDVPAHDNSAMDGYAFAGAALQPGQPLALAIAPGTRLAGGADAATLPRGAAVRIMTGAAMPPGADTVVPLELCRIDGEMLHLAADALRPGENRRRRGEDLARGQPALAAGRRLRPADLGLLASLGLAEVSVKRRLRVALFSTGDELCAPGHPLAPGCIYDSNRFSLMAALLRLGLAPVDLGLVRDDPPSLRATMERAMAEADVVLISGGVSAGDADHTRELLEQMGELHFWKVAMRPGRPFAFGQVAHQGQQRWLFALPGNPVAALVSFYALVRDGLLTLAGAAPEPIPLLQARSTAPLRKRPGRTELQRARITRGADGEAAAEITGSQGAGILRSMSEANGLLVLHHDQGSIAAGERVDVWLLDGLV
jgi:molybdopterin molybdotransferase